MDKARPAFDRILLKLSGEALMGSLDYGIDPAYIRRIAGEVKAVSDVGVEVAMVIGGGNIFRGAGLAEAGMDRGIVLFAAGTGNPFFTTDSAASLRAVEVGADIMIKGTKVDGIYDKDPMSNDDAVRYENISFDDAISKKLGVMDQTAMVMCSDNSLPVKVFNMNNEGDLMRLVLGENVGTTVTHML